MAEEILRLPPGTIKGFAKRGQIEVVTAPAVEKTASRDFAEWQRLFGKSFLGSETIESTFGIRVDTKDVPASPFTRSELERAKNLDQRLILRVNRAPDGSPLTMAKMEQMLQDKFQRGGKGKIFYDKDWYKNEEFFTKDIPRPGWALVSGGVVSDSTSKNYLQQTETLVAYLQKEVFEGRSMPQLYQEAVAEFLRQRQDLGGLVSNNWQEAAKRLSHLKINQLARQTPVEVLYDLLMNFQGTSERLLSDKWTWTSRQASDGSLVDVGSFDSDGLYVGRWLPADAFGILGVCLSR